MGTRQDVASPKKLSALLRLCKVASKGGEDFIFACGTFYATQAICYEDFAPLGLGISGNDASSIVLNEFRNDARCAVSAGAKI